MSKQVLIRELRLLHGELDLQRARFGRKETSKNTRAIVLISSSTVIFGFASSGVHGFWSLLPIAFAVIPVTLGYLAMRPSRGKEIDLQLLDCAIRDTTEYRAEQILYKKKLEAHQGDIAHLENRSSLIRIGFWVVIVSIASDVVQNIFTHLPKS